MSQGQYARVPVTPYINQLFCAVKHLILPYNICLFRVQPALRRTGEDIEVGIVLPVAIGDTGREALAVVDHLRRRTLCQRH